MTIHISRLNHFQLAVAAVVCLAATPPVALAQTSREAVQTTFIPAAAQQVVVGFPKRLLTSPQTELYPTEILSAASVKEMGFDILQVEQVTAMACLPENESPDGGVVFRFGQPIDKARALEGLSKLGGGLPQELTKATHGKYEYFKIGQSGFAVAAPSDRVLLLASEPWLKQMLDAAQPPAGKAHRMGTLLSQTDATADIVAVIDVAAVASPIQKQLDKEEIPAEYEKFKKLPSLISHLSGALSLRTGLKDRLVIQAKDEASAKELEKLIPEGLEMFRLQALVEVKKQPMNTATEKAAMRYVERISQDITNALKPARQGVQLSLEKESGTSMMEISVLNALLMPAVQRVRDAARRVQAERELKQ